jgi:hypothetical protein
MDPIVFTEAEGELYDTGTIRLRVLAQAREQPIAITDNIVPPGFPGPVPHRHTQMTDSFYVLAGGWRSTWRATGGSWSISTPKVAPLLLP